MFNEHVITNEQDTMFAVLCASLRRAHCIRMVVSFVLESGVRLLLPELRAAAGRGVPIELITSRYLNITEPSALYLLHDSLGEAMDLRVFVNESVAFHPKTYIFLHDQGGEVFVGSSNLSKSALMEGVEWNYRLASQQSTHDFQQFQHHFDRLWKQSRPVDDAWLKEYSLAWKRPRWLPPAVAETVKTIEPQGAQIEALHYLRLAREEGCRRGLVAMAPGVGKTFLAAFDSVSFRRILFVAHREEILRQAEHSFAQVMPERSRGFFAANEKRTDTDLVFASVQTLGQVKYLQEAWFAPDHFDYIVVDEFHHVAAQSYAGLVEYFQPKFLLGLTATPFRMDNQDIFEFCDDNLIYDINVHEAINKDYLVPFRYYGIYDHATDYDQIDYRAGQYVSDQLEEALSRGQRQELVIKHYLRHRTDRAIAFCSTIKHANATAEEFQKHGIQCAAVHSSAGTYVMERKKAVEALRNGDVELLITVDQFNEGVDIPDIDLVLFLRPTQSYTVFMQQLGRGLRRAPGKERVTVLDFIGNYKQAHLIPLLLTGRHPNPEDSKDYSPYRIEELEDQLAEGCSMHWDLALVDVFTEMWKRDPLKERIRREYYRLKDQLQRRPLRLDVYEGSDISVNEFLKPRHVAKRKGYLRFLQDVDDLNAEEYEWLDSEIEEFLLNLETTAMTKLYKIPTIHSLLDGERLLGSVSLDRVAEHMREFYQDPRFEIDMRDKASRRYRSWDLERWKRLAKDNPVNFLTKSSKFFQYDEINGELRVDEAVVNQQSPHLIRHVRDVLDTRCRQKVTRMYKKVNGE